MSDDGFDRLDAELRKLGQLIERLHEEGERLRQYGSVLDEINSAFPATKDFLAARGLTRVSQLDESGREELSQHLETLLRQLRTPN